MPQCFLAKMCAFSLLKDNLMQVSSIKHTGTDVKKIVTDFFLFWVSAAIRHQAIEDCTPILFEPSFKKSHRYFGQHNDATSDHSLHGHLLLSPRSKPLPGGILPYRI